MSARPDPILIPCEFEPFGGKPCAGGQVFIYGDYPEPPKTIICPRCGGTGTTTVTREFLLERLDRLKEDLKQTQIEIQIVKGQLHG